MKKYRCPKCQTAFTKKEHVCPACGQELHYLDELKAPKIENNDQSDVLNTIETNPDLDNYEEQLMELLKSDASTISPLYQQQQQQQMGGALPIGPNRLVPPNQPEGLDYVVDFSFFDGNYAQMSGLLFTNLILNILTLGIYVPFGLVQVYEWETKHTVIDGHRLAFDGKGKQLFGRYLLWIFLTIITIGFYYSTVKVQLRKWRQKHTHFEEIINNGQQSGPTYH